MAESISIRVSARFGCREAEQVADVFSGWAADNHHAVVVRSGSMGYYDLEPFVIIEKPDAPTVCYAGVMADEAKRLAESLLSGDTIPELAFGTFSGESCLSEIPLFNIQRRVATRRCGFTDPWSIDSCIAEFGGYRGFIKALQIAPDEVLERVKLPDLTESPGSDKPVYPIWKAFSEKKDTEKTIICKAIDNDIDAHTAILLLEGDPHGVLEGLLIAAYALGASRAILAVPAGTGCIYPILQNALSNMNDRGLNGNIPESAVHINISIREVPCSPVLSVDSALLRCLEGLDAVPALPEKDGYRLDGAPALIMNVETIANLAPSLLDENELPSGIKGFHNTGTKILTLAGDVSHAYSVEVPVGAKIGDIIMSIGCAADVRAFQFGGPTSVFFGSGEMEKSVSNETAGQAGAEFGLSLLNVVSGSSSIMEKLEELTQFLHGVSCGKCVFCREGLLHLNQLLRDYNMGRSVDGDIELAEKIGRLMRSNCICDIGATAANPVLSGLGIRD